MDDESKRKAAAIFKRIHAEVADDLDEEMELELDDDRIAKLTFEKGGDGEKIVAQALAAWK